MARTVLYELSATLLKDTALSYCKRSLVSQYENSKLFAKGAKQAPKKNNSLHAVENSYTNAPALQFLLKSYVGYE